jgi:hypothetical protein
VQQLACRWGRLPGLVGVPLAATARLFDPLTADASSALEAVSPPTATRRREHTVPKVTTLAGAEAIAHLRAGGFIAAIESVPSELPQGTVIEQYPQAGIQLGRDAVVVLRMAVPRTAASQVLGDADPEPPGAHVEPTADGDDTERWFAALAWPDHAKRGEWTRPRRRKHRVSSPRAHELEFDPAPTPIPRGKRPNAGSTSSTRIGRDFAIRSRLASALCVLPASLAATTWRRATVLFATLVLFTLLGTRLLATGDRRQRSGHNRVLAGTVREQLATRIAPRPIVHRAAPPVRQAVVTRRAPRGIPTRRRAAHPHDRISNPEPPPVEATPAPSPARPEAAAAPAAHAAAPANGQFAYLGQ